MALEQIRRSDYSGDEIPSGTGARIRVVFNDKSRVDLRADVTDEEVVELFPWAQPVQPRPDRRRTPNPDPHGIRDARA